MLGGNNFGFTGSGGGGGGGTVSSVGLTAPPAFNVVNSPITSSGTICLQAAGLASQYIRGDGTLADLPNFAGGAGSQQFYFNGGVSQGLILGQQSYQMSRTANTGAAANFSSSANGLLAQFITDIGSPNQAVIPAGSWFFSAYFNSSSTGGSPTINAQIYKFDGTTSTLIATSSSEEITNGTAIDLYNFAASVPQTTLNTTDRIIIAFNIVNSAGRTITLYTQAANLASVTTTFTNAISSLNGLTANVQFFQTTTTGTDFSISSSGCTHCFNLPTASCTNRGALASSDYSLFCNSTAFCLATGNVSPQFSSISILPRCGANSMLCNSASGIFSGNANRICYSSNSFIGGGLQNQILSSNAVPFSNPYSSIINGFCNRIIDAYSQLVSGFCNISCQDWLSGILNGSCNTTFNNCYSFIINGNANSIGTIATYTNFATILNGNINCVSNDYGAILGGQCNTVTGLYSGVANLCGVNASANCTFYFCNICVLGGISGGGVQDVFCNAASGTITAGAAPFTNYYFDFCAGGTLILPTAVGNTATYCVKNRSNTCIFTCFTAGQNADGTTCILYIPNQALGFVSNNTNYNII